VILRALVMSVVLAAALLLPRGAMAQDHMVRASRTAIVRDSPDTAGRELLRLERGQALNCVTIDQTDRFYQVFLSNGEQGWVSSFVVRLEEGAAPAAPTRPAAPGLSEGLTPLERQWAASHLAVGSPRGYQEIIREGYALGYDPRLKIAAWVQYRLTRESSANDSAPDTRNFREDGALKPQARSKLDDYEGSGYQRGHGAPIADLRFSGTAASESNLLSNIYPQIGSSFNASVWGSIEDRVRGWVLDRRDLTIIVGPVFRARGAVHPVERQPGTPEQILYNVVGPGAVAVPSAYFKIVVDMRTPEHPDVIAFLVDHIETIGREDDPEPAGRRERDPERWITSVDEIERQTGLDFLTGLPEAVQQAVERDPAPGIW
jgi:endonuclease G